MEGRGTVSSCLRTDSQRSRLTVALASLPGASIISKKLSPNNYEISNCSACPLERK